MRNRLFLFLIIVLISAGCSKNDNTNAEKVESSVTENAMVVGTNVEDTRTETQHKTMNEAYYSKYLELNEKYGTGAVADFKRSEYEGQSYLTGVCVVNQLDFDGDGLDDLFVLYSNGDLVKIDSYNEVYDIPTKNTYEFEIWSYKNDELVQLLHEKNVSQASIDQRSSIAPGGFGFGEYRNYLNIFEDRDGKTVIQVFEPIDDGENIIGDKYTNIYYSKNEVVKDELLNQLVKQGTEYDSMVNVFTLNGKEIGEEEWSTRVTDFNKILLCAPLADTTNTKSQLKDYFNIDLEMVINETYDVVSFISDEVEDVTKSRFHIAEDENMSLYLKVIEKADRQVSFGENYHGENHGFYLMDINQDGIDEMILYESSDGAGTHTDFYTFDNGEVVDLGMYGRADLMVNDDGGVIEYHGRMGTYQIDKINVVNNQLVIEPIDSGDIGTGEYPELESLGYYNYHDAKICTTKIPLGLYNRGYVAEK